MAQKPLSRRSFLRDASAFAAVLAWHADGGAAAAQQATQRPSAPKNDEPRFSFLRLQASRLDEMRRFYLKTLVLPLHREGKSSLSVRFGRTVIEFTAAEKGEPFYHFAFNVPENKFKQAKDWLARRCPLLRDSSSGDDEIFFKAWNAHAVYFRDPSGNIGELIARHTLKNARNGAFDEQDILYASEIGLPSRAPEQLATGLSENLRLRQYHDSSMFIGDERGLFVLPPTGRPWIPDRRQRAAVFAAEITFQGNGVKEYRPPELPYVLQRR